jgi:hypothetical protein
VRVFGIDIIDIEVCIRFRPEFRDAVAVPKGDPTKKRAED